MFDMRRREFLSGLAANAALWPISSKAQTPQKRPLIGLLSPGSKTTSGRFYDGFWRGMRERGYLERRDYDLEERYAEGNIARLPALAEQLVGCFHETNHILGKPGSRNGAAGCGFADF